MENMTDNSNGSMPCMQPPLSALGIPVAIDYIQACIALISGFLGFIFTGFILFLVVKFKRLHNRIMYLALHIIIVDFIYSVSVPPVIFTSGVTGKWLYGQVICNILGAIHDSYVMFRFTMTLILTLDRFLTVFMPFFYRRKSRKIIVTLLLVVYTVSFIRLVLPLKGILSCYEYVHTQKTCTVFTGCSQACFWLVVGHSLIILTFGMATPLILQVLLFCKAKMVRKRSMSVVGSLASHSLATVTTVMNTDESFNSCTTIQQETRNLGVVAGTPSPVPAKEVSFIDTQSLGCESSAGGSLPPSPEPSKPQPRYHIETDSLNEVQRATVDFTESETTPTVTTPTLKLPEGCKEEEGEGEITACGKESPVSVATISIATVNDKGNDSDDFLKPPKGNDEKARTVVQKLVTIAREADDLELAEDLATGHGGSKRSSFNMSRRRASSVNTINYGPRVSIASSRELEHIQSTNRESDRRINITMLILLMSVIGCTAPAFILYGIQFLYLQPEPALFIINMLVGRTFFNLIPLADSIAIMRHREFKLVALKFFRSLRERFR